MAFSPAFLDELRARINLSDVVGRRVRLVHRGREHTGLCPFHNEKTPSFTLNDDKGFFHCFGCGAHGDVIGFVMKTENLSFPEAVERLAEEAGLPVPKSVPEDKARAKVELSLFAVVEAACKWFEERLKAPEGRGAREYLIRRGVDAATVARFRLGFAPSSNGALKAALSAQGFPESLMITAGLLVVPEDGRAAYDRFRGRLMFPIEDPRGRVVAFGGRILGDGEPKYLNSPETPLFHKGRLLYGLRHARDILKAPTAGPGVAAPGTAAPVGGAQPPLLVVEGYMDAIAALSVGIAAVAPLGTALGEDQIALLWRLVSEPVLCFDGDNAGMRAAGRAAERGLPLVKPGFSLAFAALPKGDDPDTLVRRAGRAGLEEIVARARPLAEVVFDLSAAGRPIDTPERRAAIQKELTDKVGRIKDPVVRINYQGYFKRRLWEAFSDHQSPVGLRIERSSGSFGRKGASFALARISPDLDRLGTGAEGHADARERVLLLVVINHPAILPDIAEDLGLAPIGSPELDSLRTALLDIAAQYPGLDSAAVRRHLTDRGFGDTADRLWKQDMGTYTQGYSRERFSEKFLWPGATTEEALAGFYRVLAYHKRIAHLRAELETLQRELTQELERNSPVAPAIWDRFQAVQQAVLREGEYTAEEEIFGPSGAGSGA
jgi:DNA primase